MKYVIDGYNLLHAVGLLHERSRPPELKWARARLLRLLHQAFSKDTSQVTLVFDAAHGPMGGVPQQDHGNIHVLFAVHQESADELIEAIINRSSAPKQLAVVSNDRRIQKAALRKECLVKGCSEFLDDLERLRQDKTPTPTLPTLPPAEGARGQGPGVRKNPREDRPLTSAPSPQTGSSGGRRSAAESETEYWLSVFADLKDEPGLKDLSDPLEWLEEDERPEGGSDS